MTSDDGAAAGANSARSASPRWIRARAVAIAAALVAISVLLAVRKLGDFDLPWHLATGRWMATEHRIPVVDDLSYLHETVRYTYVAADLVLWGVYRVGGALGLQVLAGVLCALLMASLWSRTQTKGWVAAAVLTVALQASCTWLYLRPTLLALPLASVLAGGLERHARPRAPRWRPLAVVVFVPLLWANAHQSAVLGLALIGLWAGVHWLSPVTFLRTRKMVPDCDLRARLTATAVFALASAAACVNAAGWRYFAQPFAVAKLGDLISEWAPTSLAVLVAHEPWSLLFGVVAGLSLFARAEPGRSRLSLFELGLFVMAAALARYLRLLPFACVLVAPMVASRLEAVGARLRVVPALAAVLVPANVMVMALRFQPSWGAGFDRGQLPFGAARFAAEAGPSGPMWNFFPFGGTLIFALYPGQRVFVDGRIPTVHDPALVRQAIASSHDSGAFADLDRSFGFTWAVCSALEGQEQCIPLARSRAWAMVYWDELSAVYVRRQGPNAAIAERGYRWLRHLTPPEQVLAAAARGGVDLSHDADLAVSQAPESPRAWFVAACAGIAARDREQFERAMVSLRRLAPGHPSLEVLAQVWNESANR